MQPHGPMFSLSAVLCSSVCLWCHRGARHRGQTLGSCTVVKPLATFSSTSLPFSMWPRHQDLAQGDKAWPEMTLRWQFCILAGLQSQAKSKTQFPQSEMGFLRPRQWGAAMPSCPRADKRR